MRKILTVARNEYLKAVRTKAFIIGVLMMPIFMGGGFVIIGLKEAIEDRDDKPFAVLDRSGELYAAIENAAEERNTTGIWSEDDPEEQARSRFLPEAHAPTDVQDDGSDAALELADRVRADEIVGYLVIGADVEVEDGEDDVLAWHTDTPTYEDLPDWLEQVVSAELRRRRVAEAGLDEELIQRVTRRARVREMGLPSVDESGARVEAEESDEITTKLVPIILTMLLYMLLVMSAPAMMNGVLEEKMQKIGEVLVSAITPYGLLMGKLFATVLIALTLSTIYLGAGLVFVNNVEGVPSAIVHALRPELLAWFGVFLMLGLLIFGSIFSALGAACSEIQDAQSMMMPVMLLLISPMFFLGVILESPDGPMSRLVSFFPPATPTLMLLRVAIPPGVAPWELLLAAVTTGAFAALCVGAGAKIFRVGILAQGQTPSYRKLMSWVFSK